MKFSLNILIFLLIVKFSAAWENNDGLILQIKDGKILGRYITSETGKSAKAFMGIPYAQPPVGDLRFRAPQKVQPWEGIKSAQFDGSACFQISSTFNPGVPMSGNEDCLYLNVYTPAVINGKLPIISYIHGGGFTFGEGGRSMYGPDYILDHDVILVTGNYRLGVFGFLTTEDKHAQGNFALKDQNLILQWIQENIEYFGGDKNSVTLWGESAGAVSANYQMLSPMSRGLFHRAICNSGTIHNAWADPWRKGEALEATKRVASAVNCSTTSTSALMECLRTKSASDLASAGDSAASNWSNRMVIEDFSELSETPFLPTRALTSESVDIPWMLGINSEEGLFLSAPYIESEAARNSLISIWNNFLPASLDYNHLDAATQASITQKISQFYFGTDSLTPGFDTRNLTDFYSDFAFNGMFEVLRNRFQHSNAADTYVYFFTHKGTASVSSTTNYEGTAHVDDLIYLFPLRKSMFYSSMPTADDMTLMTEMPRLWTNFAKYGNPTTSSNKAISIPPWPKATSIPFEYMIIGNENGKYENTRLFWVGRGLYENRANFWMKLREDHKLSRWNGAETFTLSSLLLTTHLVMNVLLK